MPLPSTFDCIAYSTRPADHLPMSGMDLADKNTENVAIEVANKVSVILTRAYAKACDTPVGVGLLDIGFPLKALLGYTNEEKAKLLHCPEYAATVGPLPVSFLGFIAGIRAVVAVAKEKERVEKEAKETEAKKPLLGLMVFTKPHAVTPTLKQQAVIPAIFLVTLRSHIPILLHWWTDKNMKMAALALHTIAKEYMRSEQSTTFNLSQHVQVLDITKNAKFFGGEDESVLSPSL